MRTEPTVSMRLPARFAMLIALVAALVAASQVPKAPPGSRPRAGAIPPSRRRTGTPIAPTRPGPRAVEGSARSGAPALGGDGETWAFEAGPDKFDPGCPIDLRGLNEPVAGASGFVRLSADGASFVLGDGTSARFWAANTRVAQINSRAELAYHARFLAKRGVNMVRFHGFLNPVEPDSRIEDVNEEALEEAWRLVAAMKREGIYVTISPYWSYTVKSVPPSWGLEGWPTDRRPFGLLFFNETLQRGYRAWLKALLTRPNPYTKIPLAQDPAVAIIQLQNEDSLLFHTINQVKGPQAELLGRKFAAWATGKYGSVSDALRAWGGARSPGDDLARGVLGLEPAWKWSAPAPAGLDHRLDDQVRFYAETMRAFNTETVRYLRDDLGCRQLINAGNWRTADPIRLYDAERWSYTAAEVMASNHFYSTPHVGPTQAYRIQRGDRYVDESALLHPRKLPFLARQVAGHPMIFSETAWVAPLTYISEGPFLVASYGSLLGLDGFYWLSMTEPGWGDADKPAYISAPVNKWKAGSPMTLGQFPAAALMYRRGSIERAEPAVAEVRAEADLWQRRPPVIVEDPGYDPVRDLGDAAERADLPSEVDPLAFLVGPVQVEYRKLSAPAKVADLDRFIDRRSKTVASSTGQIRLDYGKGVCTLDAPSAQGACGFLSASSPVDLSTVSIRSEDQYAAILAVALDDRPLAESASVLVQVGTRARPTGWAESPATFSAKAGKQDVTYRGKKIDDVGSMPWRIDRARDVVTLRNPTLRSAVVLDPNGMPGRAVEVEDVEGGVEFTLPADTLYVLLTP